MIQFYSGRAGSGNDITYRLRSRRTRRRSRSRTAAEAPSTSSCTRRSGSACSSATTRARRTPAGSARGHPNMPLQAGQRHQHLRQPEPEQLAVLRPRPGPGLHGDAVLSAGLGRRPAGVGCTATQWCAALNIDTFQNNENTGQFNNTDCLNTVGPEPVNFAFLTKNGVRPRPPTRAPGALRPGSAARPPDERG